MEKKYSFLHKKFVDLQSKLTPIFSDSLNSPSTPPINSVSEKINKDIIFIYKMINAELAMKTNPDSNPSETRHLFQMIRRVQFLQKGLHALSSNARSTSSSVESYDPIMRSNIDSCLDQDQDQDQVYDRDDDEDELDDHFNNGNYPRMRFKVYENPEFFGGYDEDGDMEFGGIVNEDVKEEKCSSDDKDVGEEFEGIVKDGDTNRGLEEKEGKKRVIEEDDSYGDGDDTKTHCCVRIVFWAWVIFIVMGLVSLLSDSDIPDHHSSTVFLTPT